MQQICWQSLRWDLLQSCGCVLIASILGWFLCVAIIRQVDSLVDTCCSSTLSKRIDPFTKQSWQAVPIFATTYSTTSAVTITTTSATTSPRSLSASTETSATVPNTSRKGRRRRNVVLCQFSNMFGSQSKILMEMHSVGIVDGVLMRWTDTRSLVMNGKITNNMRCNVNYNLNFDSEVCLATSGMQPNPPLRCHPCPCKPDCGVASSSYTYQLSRLLKRERCKFPRVALVGHGISSISACITELCPDINLTIVDIDLGVQAVTSMFFGWVNQSKVVIMDALKYFQVASSRSEFFDVVAVDCFEGGKNGYIPDSCRSAAFWEAVRGVLKKPGLFIMNTFHPYVAYQHTMARIIGGPNATGQRWGQWFLLWL